MTKNMTTSQPGFNITDRSAMETDWKCPRRLYWNRFYGEQGIVPGWEEEALTDGIDIHADFAEVAEGAPQPDLPPPHEDTDENGVLLAVPIEKWERWARRVGVEQVYRSIIFPEWFEKHYEVIAIEKEMVLEYEDLWVAFTPDLILRSRTDGRLVNIDFKSVGRITREWAESWPFAVQLHLNAMGIEQEYGGKVSHSLVVGVDKGYRSDGKLRHPYTWAYTKDGSEYSREWKRDWSLAPIWERGDRATPLIAVREWALELGPETAKALFPVSAPIVPDPGLTKAVLAQTAKRMREMGRGREDFPQHFSQCRPSFGAACPYLQCCHNADVGRDPIGSGLFKIRIPHHDVWGLVE